MRTLTLLTCLAGCPPDESDYADRYQERWCETFDETCEVSVLPERCRADGAPADPIDPRVPCDFLVIKATACLSSNQWTCVDGDVVVPPVCSEVWVCE